MGLTDEFEKTYWNKNKLVLGIDEAGRGPMAGPLVVSGVIFPLGYDNPLINDSKKLTEKQRSLLAVEIQSSALWTQTIVVSAQEIDCSNIYKETQEAMTKIANASIAEMVLSDAMPLPKASKPYLSLIKGDQRSISIAAASILAKTKRDEMMIAYDATYPEYGFKSHKGYGTKKHKEAILKFGRCKIHRQTFKFKDEKQISFDI